MQKFSHFNLEIQTFRIVLNHPLFLLLFSIIFSQAGCRQAPATVESTYTYIAPKYRNINLVSKGDSIHFPLSQNTYNDVRNLDYFEQRGTTFISFYDRRSESINIYNFSSQKRTKKIYLKKQIKGKSFYKTSVRVVNFDSIIVITESTLYLMDSSGTIKKSIAFPKKMETMAFIENAVPLVIKGNLIYTGIRPSVKESSLSAVRNWKILYSFDLEKKERQRHYRLPGAYQNHYYNDRFFAYSFCFNNKGNFVFSFPADSNIYETDLRNYHVQLYGKSQFQNNPIKPFSLQELEEDKGTMEYLLRDSYGSIYFDPYKRRYLRIFKQKITKEAFEANNRNRKYSMIIFDDNFRIIGETEINNQFSYSTLFFTPNGNLYARVNPEDENALHFAKMQLVEDEPLNLTKK